MFTNTSPQFPKEPHCTSFGNWVALAPGVQQTKNKKNTFRIITQNTDLDAQAYFQWIALI